MGTITGGTLDSIPHSLNTLLQVALGDLNDMYTN